jgi:cell division transport system ATP-binding protein
MVNLVSVCKNWQGQARVLDHVTLELKRGEFVYILGGTGAGKSSLLRLIATEDAPTAGSVSLFGYDLSRISPTTLRAIRRLIGYVPQNVQLIPDLSVFDNVALSLSLANPRSHFLSVDARKKINESLERLGIASKREQMARALSGGESQRVAVARAIVRSPELIIADEPTGAQDHEHTWSMMDLFSRANLSGATVLLATHDREIVRRIRKKCVVLKQGRLTVEESGLPMMMAGNLSHPRKGV